jgi:hypothetical protein
MPIATQTISAAKARTAATERRGLGAVTVMVKPMLTSALFHEFHDMNKAFVKESEDADEDEAPDAQLPAGTRNYMTPAGHARMQAELARLVRVERPEVVNRTRHLHQVHHPGHVAAGWDFQRAGP